MDGCGPACRGISTFEHSTFQLEAAEYAAHEPGTAH
jgi:hypothetical protein